MNPLWSILNATCNNVASRPIVAVLLCGFICTILSYCFVLWPIRPLQELIKTARARGLFYIMGLRGIEWAILEVENARKLGIARRFCILAELRIRHE
jgi:hypothetical protein